jgi:diacylglycerol kinase
MPFQYLGGRSRSIAHALRGIGTLLGTQANARLHLLAAVVVIIAGAWLELSSLEWGLIAAAISGVWVSEALNTAIESVVDLVSPDIHPLARRAKDVAAAGVLLAAIASVAIGIAVLGPRVAALFM